MSFYAEDPFGLISDVHWKKKKPDDEDCPPPRAAVPHYNGFYGHGLIRPSDENLPLQSYGPHQYPGCIGWSDFRGSNIIGGHDCGGVYNYNFIPDIWYEGADLRGGNYTSSLQLLLGGVAFTNSELYFGPPIEHPPEETPVIFWTAPMGGGETYLGCFGTQNIFAPWVVLSHRLTLAWYSPRGGTVGGGETGLGLSFTPTGYGPSGAGTGPPDGQGFFIGSTSEGEFSYDYETHFWEYFIDDITHGHHYTPTDDGPVGWDFSIGGPAQLWTHLRYGDGTWRHYVSPIILEMLVQSIGDWQTWEVMPQCGEAFGPGDIGGANSMAAAAGPSVAERRRLIPPSNDRRLVRPGPPLCGESSGLVYPPLEPKMLEMILALERAREADPIMFGLAPRRFGDPIPRAGRP